MQILDLDITYMLRKRFMGALVLLSLSAGCGNEQKKTAKEEKGTAGDSKTTADTSGPTGKHSPAGKQNILFFGTSLTAGYGLDDPSDAYPALIQKKIDSLKLPYKVINGGLSGETSAGGKGRIDWLLKQPIEIFVLELGANDGLRGLSVTQTGANLQAIIDKVKKKYPKVQLVMVGMQMPPNMGATYTSEFKAIFSTLATKNKMTYIPFLLEGVGGVAKLNQGDGIHPTAEGHKILAENVWKELKGLL
jgi:acyl-CoA thioesterase-1